MPFRHHTNAVFLLLSLVAICWLSIYLVRPPEALPSDAPLQEFSAARAMQHVRQVAQEPHAMGTAAHARVRAYLVSEMKKLGLETQVQEAMASNSLAGTAMPGYVYNIMGRLKGSGTATEAVLLMAHYDSQPNTPGASDDAAGVAALLETARALQQQEALQHDVIFLLTDGEEYGLYGAYAFLDHPWAKGVGIVLNLDARGNSGPSMTFEISPGNEWVVEQLAEAAPYPFASSLMYEVYRMLPNNTDFTPFREAGYKGINSAAVAGFVHYHKLTDSPENLNQNTLQHHGSNLLALTRHLGNVPLNTSAAKDKVFFNPAGSWLLQYPLWLNYVWLALLTLLLVATCVVGAKRQALTALQVVGSFFMYLLLLAITVGVVFLLNNLVTGLLPYSHPFNGVYGADQFFIAYLLLALGLFLLLSWLALRWVRLFSLLMGVYLLCYLLVLGVCFFLLSATYLLLFPLLFCLAGTLLVFRLNLHQQPYLARPLLILFVAALPAIFMLMPYVHFLFVIFELQMPIAMVALLVLLAGLLLPLLHMLEHSYSWRNWPLLPLLLLLAGGLQLAQAIGSEAPSPQQPLHSAVSYYLNADSGEAFWVSPFQKTDEWNQQFFSDASTGSLTALYPFASRTYLMNTADTIAVPVPVAEVLTDSVAAGERHLRLRLFSPRGAAHLELVLQPEQDSLRYSTLNGLPLKLSPIKAAEEQPYYFARLYGLPVSKEVVLEARVKQGTPLRLLLFDQSIGLPQQLIKTAMPAHVIPEQGRDSNLLVVRKEYVF
ncbi:M20/M25/M40 family metallo-hydrolase [Pontibacter qinzhouensis]|uniref:Vacuolar membrane protease n=1 Tax=Pontibacter qinzhouensis TaxID=2603253 RepID=A0A5C8JIG2_9BACT|nr:M20/M25/M40 family metallo-hydrolase [Pontibacter qinzhouensis]TXK38150.1 M20/M25/M40 family metallo-hydrolase [Pontibacter qinzhouensis]